MTTTLEVSLHPSQVADILHRALQAMAHFGSAEDDILRLAALLVAAERASAAAFNEHERAVRDGAATS